MLPISLFFFNQFLLCAQQNNKKVHILEIGMYNLYSYISFVMPNIDVQNTEEQWLLNLLRNRIIHVNCSHKGYWHGLFSSLLALETIFTNPTSNRRLKMSPNRSFKVKKKSFHIRRVVHADVLGYDSLQQLPKNLVAMKSKSIEPGLKTALQSTAFV